MRVRALGSTLFSLTVLATRGSHGGLGRGTAKSPGAPPPPPRPRPLHVAPRTTSCDRWGRPHHDGRGPGAYRTPPSLGLREPRLQRPGLRKDRRRRNRPLHAPAAGRADQRRHRRQLRGSRGARQARAAGPRRHRALRDGLAAAPMSAPGAVQEIIWAGNQLIGLPYIYGGGHASFVSPGTTAPAPSPSRCTARACLHPDGLLGIHGLGRTGIGRGSRSSPTPNTPT